MKFALCLFLALATHVQGIKVNAQSKRGAWPRTESEVDAQCEMEKQEMLRKAQHDFDVSDAEWRRQKRILNDKKTDHKNEAADVNKQESVVSKEESHVSDAAQVVSEYSHCPAELERAQALLTKLLGEPNTGPADVDAECTAEKKVLKYQACVDKLRSAEARHAMEKDEHAVEKTDLAHENREESAAAQEIPPQKGEVGVAKSDLDAKRARLKEVKDGIEATRD
jgi:hypothetical protein